MNIRTKMLTLLLATLAAGTGVTCLIAQDDLLAKSNRERESKLILSLKDCVHERNNAASELISIINNKESDRSFEGSRHMAIRLAGELRSEKAVVSLANQITFVPEGWYAEDGGPRQYRYVAAVSLTQISGEAVVEEMVGIIASSTDKERSEVAAWVLLVIEGKEQAIYRMERLASSYSINSDKFNKASRFIKAYNDEIDHFSTRKEDYNSTQRSPP